MPSSSQSPQASARQQDAICQLQTDRVSLPVFRRHVGISEASNYLRSPSLHCLLQVASDSVPRTPDVQTLLSHRRGPTPCRRFSCISEDRKMRVCHWGYMKPVLCGLFEPSHSHIQIVRCTKKNHGWKLGTPGVMLYCVSRCSAT